jgi:hypothetical protein
LETVTIDDANTSCTSLRAIPEELEEKEEKAGSDGDKRQMVSVPEQL